MSGKPTRQKRANTERFLLFLNGYCLVTVLLFVLLGLVMLFTAWGDEQLLPLLRQQDALFGISTRVLLLIWGLAHLILGGYLLFTEDSLGQGLALCWVDLNYIIYLIGMVWMEQKRPFALVKLIGWKTGVSTAALETCWKLLILYLAIGSAVLIVWGWRESKRLRDEVLLKRWREMRESSDAQPNTVASKSPRDAFVYLKMSCALCGGHVEFPVNNLGQKAACPHCKATITLLARNL